MKIEAIDMSKIIGSMRITVTGGKRATLRFRVATPILRLGARVAGVQLDIKEPASGGPLPKGRHYIVGEQGPEDSFVNADQARAIAANAIASMDHTQNRRLA